MATDWDKRVARVDAPLQKEEVEEKKKQRSKLILFKRIPFDKHKLKYLTYNIKREEEGEEEKEKERKGLPGLNFMTRGKGEEEKKGRKKGEREKKEEKKRPAAIF